MDEQLNDYEIEIINLSEQEGPSLCQHANRIEIMSKFVSNKLTGSEKDFLIDIPNPNETIYKKLASDLINLYPLSMAPLTKNNIPISIEEFAIPSSSWSCHYCKIENKSSEVQCIQCHAFRKIETFPNIIKYPTEITQEEIQLFQQRRALEKRIICGRDLLNINTIQSDECWYLISANWLKEWKAYIVNKPSKLSTVCSHPQIGVLPPGPITNNTLLMNDNKTARPSLKKVSLLMIIK